MKIFISWSGKISHEVAKALKELLPDVFHSVEPFISNEIDKGKRWSETIAKELESTKFGIICVTRENRSSPWLNFEAGALSKMSDSNVCTLAFGLKPGEILSPLNQFQATRYEREDIKNLISTINANPDLENPLDQNRLDKYFERFWQDISDALKPIYQLTNKKVIWAYEESQLNSELEIQEVNTQFTVNNTKWYLDKNEKPEEKNADILIYVYGQFSESKLKLQKVIDFARLQKKEVTLIVYTPRNKRLSDDEYEIVSQYSSYKIANMMGTLIDRFREIV